jgi:drug/metabolite transporter (DMT)-like permease
MGATFGLGGYERAFTDVYVIAGIVVLALWFLTQLALFSRADLSFVLPVTSFAYVLLAVVAHFFLDEEVSPLRWVGISLIFVGVFIVGATRPKTIADAGRLEALE